MIGQPGSPVVFTSLRDDTKGAGFRVSDGLPQTDTNNDGSATLPGPGDWRSILIDQYAHDRNVDVYVESEAANVVSPGSNATTSQAEILGALASSEKNGDENLRLGFEVHGLLNARNDIDVYSFQARAGTEARSTSTGPHRSITVRRTDRFRWQLIASDRFVSRSRPSGIDREASPHRSQRAAEVPPTPGA